MPTIFEPQDDYSLRFRELLASGKPIMAPGAFIPLVGIQAREAGFECLYFSGGAFSAGVMGIPDVGLFTLTELAEAVRRLVSAARLPVIVDADTGFGEALNVARTVRELEEAGTAAVHIEDQRMPKKCGHLEGKEVVPAREMAEKIAAAVKARRGLSIIARTDARAIEGMDGAIARGNLYKEAGADIIFPEAMQSEDEFALFAREVPGPLLANMTEFGKSPLLGIDRLFELGYQVVIYPVSSLRIAAGAVARFFEDLKARGTQADMVPDMLTRDELYRLIDYQAYTDFDADLRKD